MKAPSVILYHLTHQCQEHCPYCWLKNSQREVDSKCELTLEEIRRTFEHLQNPKVVIVSGGEPFLREDIADVLQTIAEASRVKNMVVTTNGLFVERIKRCVQQIAKQLNFNLKFAFPIDGLREEHNRVKGQNNAFDNLMESHSFIRSLHHPRITTSFSITYVKNVEDSIEKTVAFLHKQIRPDGISITFPRGELPEDFYADLDLTKYRKLSQQIRQDNNITDVLRSANIFGYKKISQEVDKLKKDIICRLYQKEPAPGFRCVAGNRVVVIFPDGTVPLCELRTEEMGSLRDSGYDLMKILQAEKAQAVRKQMLDEGCQCTHECFLGPNIVFNWPQVLFFYVTQFGKHNNT